MSFKKFSFAFLILGISQSFANPLIVSRFARDLASVRVESRVYEVTEEHETLRTIAEKLFKKAHLWMALRDSNPETLGKFKADDALSIRTKIHYQVRVLKGSSEPVGILTAPLPLAEAARSDRSLASLPSRSWELPFAALICFIGLLFFGRILRAITSHF